jgi:VWFA-related protein
MLRTRWALVACIGLAGLPLHGQSQQPAAPAPPQAPPTFKVEVNYVEIDARVTDAQGAFVGDLAKADFQVLEEGTPQTITVFSRIDLPVERHDPPLFKAAPIEPDVQTNRGTFNGRVFVLLLDDLQTDFRRSARVKAAARQFIERYIGANDLAAVVYTGGAADRGQEFTGSRARLLASVDKFMGSKLPSATMTTLDDYYAQRNSGSGQAARDTSQMERGYKARNTLAALKGVADFLSGVRGRRKAVVWFGEGIDYNMDDPFKNQDASVLRDTVQEAIAAATRADVSFYGVDARGLGAGLDEAIDISSVPADDPNAPNPSTSVQDEVRRAQDSLRVISEQTGGFAVVNQNDLNAAFERIVRDNSSYYVLGYYSSNDKRDGKLRRIQVRVTRPGVRVQARDAYTAPKGRPVVATSSKAEADVPPDVRDALASPIPSTGVGLSVFAAPFSGPGSKSSIALVVEFDPARLNFVERDGKFNEDLQLHVLAIDAAGKLQDGGLTTVPLRLSEANHRAVSSYGFRVMRRLNVPPGRYQLRVAVKEMHEGAVGTVRQTLDVPDFSKSPLQLSGIALTSISATRMPTANPDEQLKGVLPGAPTAIREFPRADTLALFAEVYDNQTSTPHRVAISSSLIADDGRVVVAASDERSSGELQGKKGAYGYTREIPLSQIAPGRYVLRIEARTLLANGATATREVELRVR